MPKATQIRECSWCQEIVQKLFLARHFTEECKGRPPLTEKQRICVVCQEVRETNEFHKRSRRYGSGTNNTCKHCANKRTTVYNNGIRATRETRKAEEIKKRPGRYVFRPCPFCNELYRYNDLLLHKPRCPKKPYGQGVKTVPAMDIPKFSPETTDEATLRRSRGARTANLMRSYGIDCDGFERMLAEQKGLCAICETSPDPNHPVKHKRVLAVDHDHATGKVRGLLCYNCNHGIGNFLEDPMLIVKAILYLRRYKEFDLEVIIHALVDARFTHGY